jgi:hypothetical protein
MIEDTPESSTCNTEDRKSKRKQSQQAIIAEGRRGI